MSTAAAASAAGAARRVDVAELPPRCDPASLDLDGPSAAGAGATGAALPPLVGQPRACEAAAFALDMRHEGYHLFIAGPAGAGKRTLARRAVAERIARQDVERADWVYVYNFELPHRPRALRLPAGEGARLRADMVALVQELRATIPAMFESEEYVNEVERINTEFKERAERALEAVGQEAQRRGLAMLRTPVGFTFAPQKDGEVLSNEAFDALTPEQREALGKAVGEVQEQLVKVLHASMRLRKEHAERIRATQRAMTLVAVEHAFEEILARFAQQPQVHRYLLQVRDDVVEHADDFRAHAAEAGGEALAEPRDLGRYEVNLLVDAAADGTTIVEADLPSYRNLFGRIEYLARFGALLTDFRLVRPGLLHRANGGYLLLDALKLLTQPFAWEALKRALLRREIRIESVADLYGLAPTVQLEPEPIPLQVKVILVGERAICQLLQRLDAEFGQLFRVQADLDDDLPRSAPLQRELARALISGMQACELLAPTAGALARLIDHAARNAGDALRLSASVQPLIDVMCEADFGARRAGHERVEAADVEAAIAARRERAARIDGRLREAMLRRLLAIDTQGERVGQVNALTVYAAGDMLFGAPTRVTATTRLGDGQVVDVQRETHMSGPSHAKGVLILSSFLAARFSRQRPHPIVASLVFEQTYGMVDGDSASLAELAALLSSIGDLPIRQCWAVTGSVDQFGAVQAVGGVDEKIEGFFDLCAARGLDGSHGVIVPEANVAQLMLRADVVDAVRDGRFALHAASSIDQAMALLTGLPAGDSARPADDTVNGRIARRLVEWTTIRRGEARGGRARGRSRSRPAAGDRSASS